MSAWPTKGQCRNSKFFLPLVLVIKVVQNIFFPETYNASTFLSLDSRCDSENCLKSPFFYHPFVYPGVTSYVNYPLVLSRLFAFFAVVAAINVLLIECFGKKKVILGFFDENNTVSALNSSFLRL